MRRRPRIGYPWGMRLLVILSALLLAACGSPRGDFAEGDPTPTPTVTGPEGCDVTMTPALDLVLVDRAADLGVQDAGGVNNGLAAEDFDGDGDIDLLLANPGPRHEMLLQQDDGTFERHPDGPSIHDAPAASAVDYDNDGDIDLYLNCGMWDFGCASRLFRNDGLDGDGRPQYTDVTEDVGLFDPDVSNFGGAWADFDLDGDLDLFQGCKSLRKAPDVPSADQLWRNDDGVFVDVAAEAGLDREVDSHQAVWLDHDSDGWPDLFVPVLAGPNLLYRNNRDGTFDDVTPNAMAQPINAFAALAADYNQDGHIDIFVSGRSELLGNFTEYEEHGLFINDGAGGWLDWTMGTGLNEDGDGATHIGTMGLQGGDLDLDGYPEVAFGTGDPMSGERNALGSFVPDGDGLLWVDRTDLIDSAGQATGNGMPPYPFRTHGMAMVDLDGDFDVDLYMGNGGGPASEPNQLWNNETVARNHALRISLEGTTSNARGIGARIRVANGPEDDSSWAVYRTVQATSGFNSSRPATVTVGLGHCEGPYHVTVSWPGGDDQVLEDVEEIDDTTVITQD
jgi:hypothetical protein